MEKLLGVLAVLGFLIFELCLWYLYRKIHALTIKICTELGERVKRLEEFHTLGTAIRIEAPVCCSCGRELEALSNRRFKIWGCQVCNADYFTEEAHRKGGVM
jgi:ribosomal protein L37AE/L43A